MEFDCANKIKRVVIFLYTSTYDCKENLAQSNSISGGIWRRDVGFWRSKLHLTCSQKAATSNQDIKQEQPGSRLPGDHYGHDEGADVFVLLCDHHRHDEGADFFVFRVRGDWGD